MERYPNCFYREACEGGAVVQDRLLEIPFTVVAVPSCAITIVDDCLFCKWSNLVVMFEDIALDYNWPTAGSITRSIMEFDPVQI